MSVAREPQTRPPRRRWVATFVAAFVVGATLLMVAGPLAAHSPDASGTQALAIYQSHNLTEQGTFTVSLKLSNVANVHFVYFNFCQLGTGVCYTPPITMAPQAANWFVGTTKPMTSYPGMNPGAVAGYNITVLFNDNSTLTEPNLPNAFTNLTVVQSVSGEYMFRMMVQNLVFGLGGVVTDAATGHHIVGATVALTPGANTTTTDGSGAYAFHGLFNGTYNLTVSYSGYPSSHVAVVVNGQDVVKDLSLTNGPSSPGGSKSSNGGLAAMLTGPVLWAVVAAVAAVALLGVWWYRHRSLGSRAPEPPASLGGEPPSNSEP